MLVQSRTVAPDDLLERVRAAGRRPADRHPLADPRLRAGRDQRARGEQGRACCSAAAPGSGSTPRRVAAFGDMPNDVDMLSWAGMPHVVANAHPVLLAGWLPGGARQRRVRASAGPSWPGSSPSLLMAGTSRAGRRAGRWPGCSAASPSACAPVLVGALRRRDHFGGGRFVPWRPVMVDLDVYRRAGPVLLAGRRLLRPARARCSSSTRRSRPCSPCRWRCCRRPSCRSAGPSAGALALLAVLHRFGLTGWVLSLVGDGASSSSSRSCRRWPSASSASSWSPWSCSTWSPGRGCSRRLLPEGALTALGGGDQAHPGDLRGLPAAGRQAPRLRVAVVTGLRSPLASAAVVPPASLEFWGRLAHGDTGLGGSIIYYTNQSVMADVVRIFGLGPGAARGRLVGCGAGRRSAGSGPRCSGTGGVTSAWRSPSAGWPACWPPRCPGCTTSSGSSRSPSAWPRPAGSRPSTTGRLAGVLPAGSGARLGVRRLGGGRAVPPAAQRRRRRAAVDLVAAPARLDRRAVLGRRPAGSRPGGWVRRRSGCRRRLRGGGASAGAAAQRGLARRRRS